jgi:predicted transcriptional regulator
MAGMKQKFSTQVDPEILQEVRALADAEGRQLQALIEEAFADLIEKRRQSAPRKHIMAHYRASLEKFGPLYERLAK